MKNAPITNGNESAPNKRKFTIFDLVPRRQNTSLVAVLVRLLEGGSVLTVREAVMELRVSNLSAAIRVLKKKYGWPIDTIEVRTYAGDAPPYTYYYVKGYRLAQVDIDYAFSHLDAASWIEMVKVAQGHKREIDDAKAAAFEEYRSAYRNVGSPLMRSMLKYLYGH